MGHHLDSSLVPSSIRNLVTIASEWGATTNSEFDHLSAKVSESDMEKIRNALLGKHHLVEDWIYEMEEDGSPLAETIEMEAFRGLLRFESELMDGPGISGYFDWCVRRYREEGSDARKARLIEEMKRLRARGGILFRKVFETKVSDLETEFGLVAGEY